MQIKEGLYKFSSAVKLSSFTVSYDDDSEDAESHLPRISRRRPLSGDLTADPAGLSLGSSTLASRSRSPAAAHGRLLSARTPRVLAEKHGTPKAEV